MASEATHMDMDEVVSAQLPLPVFTKASPYLVYEKYILPTGFSHQEDDLIPLDDFNINFNVVDSPSRPQVPDAGGLTLFPGEMDDGPGYCLPSEAAKKFCWSILDSIQDNERNHACWDRFHWHHLHVSRATGKAKFNGVQILRGLPPAQLEAKLKENYEDARQIILHLFGGSVPSDLGDLLDQVHHHFADRSLFSIHPALVPTANQSALFLSMYETILHVIPVDQFHAILQEMGAAFPSYLASWRASVNRNHLLLRTFMYNNSTSYGLSQSGRPLSRDDRKMLKLLRIDPTGRQTPLTQDEVDLIEALQLLVFIRNRTSHPMEDHTAFLAETQEDYNSLGSQRITHGRFPLIAGFLLRQLHQRHYLSRIPVHIFFC